MRTFSLFVGLVLASTASAQTVSILNSSSWDIHQLYISSVNTDSWGVDQLGTRILATGQAVQLQGVPCGDYDSRLIDEDGDECIVQSVRMCGDQQFVIDDETLLGCQFDTATDGSTRVAASRDAAANVITIRNDSMWDITQFYLSTVHSNDWGPDQLGREIFNAGETLTLSGIPCGQYDAMLIDEDGDTCVLRGATLCGSEQFEISSDDLIDCQVDTEVDGYVDER